MDKLWWRAAWGLCLVQLSLAQLQIDLNITCRYAGVFHVEKNGRYSISRTEAPDLCKAFNSTLPTMAQMQQALAKGFETCRYGFIQGHVVIPRIHPNAICAANNTGVYILTSNTSHYDTYCFNASAPLDEDCTSVTDLPNSFDGIVTITIVNRDGTRYSKKGEYRTHEEDINPSQPMDEDMSSGSSSERSTSGGYTIFHTHLPTSQPSTDQEDAGVSENNPTTKASAHDGHPDQRMTTQSQEDDFWTDHFDPISHPMGRGHQTERTMDVDSSHSTTLQPPVDPNTDSVEDVNGTGPISVTTQHSHSQSFSTSHGELEEDKEQTTISTITSSNRNDGRGGRRGGNPPEDSTTSLEGKTSHYPDTRENRTLIPVTPAQPGVFGVTEVPVGDFTSNVDGSLPGDQDAGGRSHTTHGSGSAGHSSGSQEGGATTTSGPIRKPHIPEWLIILASLLALALILAVCIAVNSRRRCGQKKKLVINNGNGTVDDRKPSGLNGEASKSQEMVHLVNKESSETPDQFMTADETRNLQNVDMKIGV
ncbi:CD44 antigen isoform X13 [Marmota monax]|uniref:CD44 antigen isoform X13 n=1 Tax=Marmota monax TaxID=9995 RepID=UPI001EB0062F|nr:CD44 antigen isoform X13 [Marmota monax]